MDERIEGLIYNLSVEDIEFIAKEVSSIDITLDQVIVRLPYTEAEPLIEFKYYTLTKALVEAKRFVMDMIDYENNTYENDDLSY